jgi:hypothetical protein
MILLKYLAFGLTLVVVAVVLLAACLDEGDVEDCARGWAPSTGIMPVAVAARPAPPAPARPAAPAARPAAPAAEGEHRRPRTSLSKGAAPTPARSAAPRPSTTPHRGDGHGPNHVVIDLDTDSC